MSSSSDPAVRTCPTCGATGTGKFCAECGAAMADAMCAGCRAQLSPGARFCHRCGTAVGTIPAAVPPMRGGTNIIPWAVVAIAVLALVTFVAGQRFGSSRNGAPEGAGLDDRGGASGGLAGSPGADPAAAMAAGGPTGRAPDISAMSPRQRAERLFDRVMRLDAEGKQDSVQMFAPMAMAAYQMIDLLDLDLRYDYGRVARVSGAREVARAQADTILRVNATHLLGLILAGQVARDGGDSVAARAFDRRLVAAEPTEMQRPLDEYKRHQQDILTAAAEARKSRQP